MLQQAGFIDIQETIIRAPYNSWPADPHQKEIGRWYNLGICEGLEALSLAPLTRIYRWDAVQHVKPLVEAAVRQIRTKKIHAYNNMWVSPFELLIALTPADIFGLHGGLDTEI